MIKRRYTGMAMLILAGGMTITSCKKKSDPEPVIPPYTTPATYTFDNVEYGEASGRVSMWAGFTGYLGKATSRTLSQDTINNLWNNTGNVFNTEIANNLPFTPAAINALGFNLSGKVSDASLIKQFADSQVVMSNFRTATASQGVPGKVGSRLVNYAGLEFNQAVAKGLMGAFQMAQVITYLDKTTTDNNTTVNAGTGTAMQHDWDMAFGFVGIPADYDSSKAYVNTEANRPLAIGGYFKERGRYIQAGGIIYEAFRKGRAAINNKDYKRRDTAIATIKLYMEKTLAAAAYEYMSLSTAGGADNATRFHALSEGYGFIIALKYRSAGSPLTNTQYQDLLNIVQTSFYTLVGDASYTKINQARTILTTAYGQLQP